MLFRSKQTVIWPLDCYPSLLFASKRTCNPQATSSIPRYNVVNPYCHLVVKRWNNNLFQYNVLYIALYLLPNMVPPSQFLHQTQNDSYANRTWQKHIAHTTNTETSKSVLHWSFYFPHFQMPGTWITLFTVQKLFGATTYRLPRATELSQTQIHGSHLNSTEQASWLNQLAMIFQAKYWYEHKKQINLPISLIYVQNIQPELYLHI